jgi:hypothetical protein
VLVLAPWFVAAGVAIGCVETAEHAAVAALAPVELRGSAFGLLAAVQSFGNLAASTIVGLLWMLVSPRVAFAYLVAWMLLAVIGVAEKAAGRRRVRAVLIGCRRRDRGAVDQGLAVGVDGRADGGGAAVLG